MSYDVYLMIDTGGDVPAPVTEGRNYTYNCAAMFRLALGGNGINDLHGMRARDAVGRLEAAVAHMSHPDNEPTYRALNPKNGWGKHETATEFLADVLKDCRRHPRATIEVC